MPVTSASTVRLIPERAKRPAVDQRPAVGGIGAVLRRRAIGMEVGDAVERRLAAAERHRGFDDAIAGEDAPFALAALQPVDIAAVRLPDRAIGAGGAVDQI